MKLTKKQEELIRKLNHHVQQVNVSSRDESFWQEVAINFPQFIEEVIAHRAIIEVNLENLSQDRLRKPGTSWALDVSGVIYFVKLFEDSSDYTFIYTTALIKAFNLGKFSHFLNHNESPLTLTSHSLHESELVCLEYYKSLTEPKVISLNQLLKFKND